MRDWGALVGWQVAEVADISTADPRPSLASATPQPQHLPDAGAAGPRPARRCPRRQPLAARSPQPPLPPRLPVPFPPRLTGPRTGSERPPGRGALGAAWAGLAQGRFPGLAAGNRVGPVAENSARNPAAVPAGSLKPAVVGLASSSVPFFFSFSPFLFLFFFSTESSAWSSAAVAQRDPLPAQQVPSPR